MGTIGDNSITASDKTRASTSIGARSKGNLDRIEASGASFLYTFDASGCAVGTPPAHIISEDSSDAYEIVDAGGDLGKGLVKKSANTTTKWCFFNSYNTFGVPVKATFYFYMTNLSAFQFLFGLNIANTLNTGGRPTGITRDAGSGHGKYSGRSANTNSSFISNLGALDLDAGGYAYMHALSTGVQYIAEIRIESSNNKQRMRVSADGGETRLHTVENDGARGQDRLAFLDGVGMTPQIHLKRVEVIAL